MSKIREKDIAIIGFAFKLPGADKNIHFWENLCSGKNCISEVTRWDINKHYHPEMTKPGKTCSKWAGMLDSIDMFDAEYFNIPPKEAALIDPMQRLFIETVADVLDTSGYGGKKLWGSATGVFAGVSINSYCLSNNNLSSGIHKSGAMIANRVSHFYHLSGPSITIDTLCSSTLVAIHEASQSLHNKECKYAIAGGINIIFSVDHFIVLSNMHLLSPSGKCRTFDNETDGFVLGEGVGAFLLRPLKDAIADRDNIWCIIKGSAVNHNGFNPNPNIMSMNAPSIENVVTKAIQNAQVKPETISFIETNGTGASTIADAIEVKGLTLALNNYIKKNTCALGAVKTLIGNLEAAGGVGALVKIILSMKFKKLPPNSNFKKLNSLIKLDKSPFYLCNSLMDWVPEDMPRRAGINACGIGGTNCHIIIEEPPSLTNKIVMVDLSHENNLLCLSARSMNALKILCTRYIQFISEFSDINIQDLCMTNNTGRFHFKYRVAIIANNVLELKNILQKIVNCNKNNLLNIHNVYFNLPGDAVLKNNQKQNIKFYKSLQSTFGRNINKKQISDDEKKFVDELMKIGFSEAESKLIFCCTTSIDKKFLATKYCSKGVIHYIAFLYSQNIDIDFEPLYKKYFYNRIPLPAYPFEKKTFHINYKFENKKNIDSDFFAHYNLLNEIDISMSLSQAKQKMETIIVKAISYFMDYPISNIKTDITFSEIGIDSLVIIKLITMINNQLGIHSNPYIFYLYNTISSLSSFLAKRFVLDYNNSDNEQQLSANDFIILKEAKTNHFNDIKRWINNPDINQWLDPFFQNGFSALKYSYFLKQSNNVTYIIDRKDTAIGLCGFVNIEKHNMTSEAWIVIGDYSARSQGEFFGAGIELCKKGFYELNFRTITAKIRFDNESALNMIRYSKWREVGILVDSLRVGSIYHDCYLYQISKTDFKKWMDNQL